MIEMDHTLSRGRFPVALLAIAIAVLLSGCPGPDPADCNCPNLIETASSIDWLGDGTAPSRVTTSAGVPSFPREAILHFEVSDVAETQQQVEDRLKSFPTVFQIGRDYQGSGTFNTDDWSIYVGSVVVEDLPSVVLVRVGIVDDDGNAPTILAPIVEVLGTVPTQ